MFSVEQQQKWPFKIFIIGPGIHACAEVIVPYVESRWKTIKECNEHEFNEGVLERAQVMCDALNQTSDDCDPKSCDACPICETSVQKEGNET